MQFENKENIFKNNKNIFQKKWNIPLEKKQKRNNITYEGNPYVKMIEQKIK